MAQLFWRIMALVTCKGCDGAVPNMAFKCTDSMLTAQQHMGIYMLCGCMHAMVKHKVAVEVQLCGLEKNVDQHARTSIIVPDSHALADKNTQSACKTGAGTAPTLLSGRATQIAVQAVCVASIQHCRARCLCLQATNKLASLHFIVPPVPGIVILLMACASNQTLLLYTGRGQVHLIYMQEHSIVNECPHAHMQHKALFCCTFCQLCCLSGKFHACILLIL